jgi:hypothetical protein
MCNHYVAKENILLEAQIIDEINATLDALCQEDIPRGRNGHNMRVLIEGFKRDRVMIFSRSLACVMKLDQISRRQRFICNWVSVVVLPVAGDREDICGHERRRTCFSQGIMFVRSKTVPVPSALRAQTG